MGGLKIFADVEAGARLASELAVTVERGIGITFSYVGHKLAKSHLLPRGASICGSTFAIKASDVADAD